MMIPFRKALVPASLLLVAVVGFFVYRNVAAIDPFNPATQPVGYVAQDEITSYNLRSGNEVLFRGEYEREFWSGTVHAYKIDPSGNLTGGSVWWTEDAGALITQQNFDTGRLIGTMRDDGTRIPFRMANLSATQQGYLSSENVLNYLRGDRSLEIPSTGALYRQRANVMGDVVHSRPYYVADASNPTLFVGANGGMLHAINASNDPTNGGRERWAYVPSMLIPKMKKLTEDPYSHDYFVDGQINVAQLTMVAKRVLVGGLGGGGKGIFALDITGSAGLIASTEQQVANKVLWEISPSRTNYAQPTTDNAYINLGYTYGTMSIVPFRTGGVVKDVVIVGNGYNDGLDPSGGNVYAGCKHATPTYANCGGDYAAYLYVIDAVTGERIRAIKAGSSGTVLAPNGLSTAVAVDSDSDGTADIVYAGDLNGTMWKFDLAAGTSTALLVTSPAQPITGTPGVAAHPNGGFMVAFGTGKMLTPTDATDTSVHYVYGVWDGAPAANAQLLNQTMSSRDYVNGGTTIRVRRTTSNQPVWLAGATNHKGWKVALPAGERLIGEGSFIENGRFYFTASNPTVSTAVPNTTTTVNGEAFLIELDYLTGGSSNVPFLDLSGDLKLDDNDRLKYIEGDTIPTGSAVGDPIKSTDGIPVGKFISIGLLSQPILVQLVSLNDTLFNQNPDVVVPTIDADRGVEGGHFDVEIYYGPVVKAIGSVATITVSNTGQKDPFPATLGAIRVDGTVVVPALTTSDIPNGMVTTTNAEKIRSKVQGGFTATRIGNTVYIQAPAASGASFNGKSLEILAGTSQTQVTAQTTGGSAPSAGSLKISSVTRAASDVSIKCGSTYVTGQPGDLVSLDAGTSARFQDIMGKIDGKTVNGYKATCTKSSGSYTGDCTITAPVGQSACSGGFSVTSLSLSSNTGPKGGTNPTIVKAQTGWTDFKPALTATAFSGGVDPGVAGNNCGANGNRCTFRVHEHEYDDIFDRTGVNFLNASNPALNLDNAIPLKTTQFKVLGQNQYLSPALRLHIGNPNYLYNVDAGYIDFRAFQTKAGLDITKEPTYTTDTIGSLVFNLPPDAFSNKNWWGGTGAEVDIRDGLHPTEYGCVVQSDSASRDGNMYQPVNPPATVTASGNGTKGWSSSTTQTTATGVRHNGAAVLQIIRGDTPNSAIEMSVPNRPEYGYRVMAGKFAEYVLAEYAIFHHTKHLGLCYGDENVTFKLYGVTYNNVSWTKTPAVDTRLCGTTDTATTKKCATEQPVGTATDPKIGNIGGGSDVQEVVTQVVGDVTTTTIRFVSGLVVKIVRTVQNDGSVVIVTYDVNNGRDEERSREVIANKSGAVKSGGDERGLQARTGRISWRELLVP